MNWNDAIKLIDKNGYTGAVDIEDFIQLFGISVYIDQSGDECDRFTKYYVPGYSWICTDEMVGAAIYFMDDEPIAVSTKSARKSGEDIGFISKMAAEKVWNFIVEIINKQRFKPETTLVNMDEIIDDWSENFED